LYRITISIYIIYNNFKFFRARIQNKKKISTYDFSVTRMTSECGQLL